MLTYLQYTPILVVLAIYVLRMLEVGTKRAVVKGPVQEKITFRLFMVSGLIAAFGGIAEFIMSGRALNPWLMLLGITCAIASFNIRRAAISALGKFWSLHVEIRDNHEFVRSGPFRWMRHPTYFSMILELLSAIFILSSWWTGLLAFLLFTPAMLHRLSIEEKAMVEKFGDQYLVYQKETPILIPFRFP